ARDHRHRPFDIHAIRAVTLDPRRSGFFTWFVFECFRRTHGLTLASGVVSVHKIFVQVHNPVWNDRCLPAAYYPERFPLALCKREIKNAPMAQDAPEKILEIKKYPNRRYYDATHSRHLTLEEIRSLIQQGYDIRVTDAKSSADITAQVLT